MRQISGRVIAPMILGVLLLLALGFSGLGGNLGRAADIPPKGVLLAFAPGGVLTRDGTLWQYRIDKGVWLTIDDAFAQEGRTTHVLPLPAPATQIAQMQSFGFIVTTNGSCWLYDLEKDKWKEIGAPPVSR